MTGALLCAVDRGIASARAGIIDAAGALLGRDAHPIALHHPSGTMAEHRSDDIWAAVCAAVTGAMAAAEAAAGDVAAIGFGATCSLVARGADGGPVSLALDGAPGWDTLAWRHHRAGEEAAEAAIPSPEMQPPKLMWLKHRLPDRWAEAARICDLADFLTWRATGATARSACTLTSKWGWNADGAPPEALLATFGLTGMPPRAAPVGSAVGRLTPAAAADLGLAGGCAVAAGMIDAYAGALGVPGGLDDDRLAEAAALIAGALSCVMTLRAAPTPPPGLWGPYADVVLPGLWAAEGGQSAAGGLLDHIVRVHGAGLAVSADTHGAIAARVAALRAQQGDAFAADLHVPPDFHGNQSPFGDPRARGDHGAGYGRLVRRAVRAVAARRHRAGAGAAADPRSYGGARHGRLGAAPGWRPCPQPAAEPALRRRHRPAGGGGGGANDAPQRPPPPPPPPPGGGGRTPTRCCWAPRSAPQARGGHGSLRAAARVMAPAMTRRTPDPGRAPALERDLAVPGAMQDHRRAIAAIMAAPHPAPPPPLAPAPAPA
jgi:sugar (pentulose or hexulose) kinase